MAQDSILTPVTEVNVGDYIDFYPILENVSDDETLEVARMVSESETFVVEEIAVEDNAIVLYTDNLTWAFPLTDKVLVCGSTGE